MRTARLFLASIVGSGALIAATIVAPLAAAPAQAASLPRPGEQRLLRLCLQLRSDPPADRHRRHDIAPSARQLANEVNQVLSQTGASKVDIVGWS